MSRTTAPGSERAPELPRRAVTELDRPPTGAVGPVQPTAVPEDGDLAEVAGPVDPIRRGHVLAAVAHGVVDRVLQAEEAPAVGVGGEQQQPLGLCPEAERDGHADQRERQPPAKASRRPHRVDRSTRTQTPTAPSTTSSGKKSAR